MDYGAAASSPSPRRRTLRDRIRSFRPLVQVVAFLSLFLVGILSAFIVPIVPDYLDVVNVTEIKIGALLAANSFVTIFANPVAAFVTDRYGYQIPVVGGFLLYAVASFLSAFAKQIAANDLTKTYIVLFVTRAIQGVGDAFSVVASLSMVAIWYTSNDERANAIGNAFAAAGIGFVIGYPFGGAFSAVPGGSDAGWKWPFIITGLVSLASAIIALLMGSSPPGVERARGESGPSMLRLLCDPYVLVCCLSLISTYSSLALIEPLLPVWMKGNFKDPVPTTYSVGLILLSFTLAFTFGSFVYGRLPGKRCYWLNALVSQIMVAACLALLPLVALARSHNLYYSIIPLFFLGFSYALADLVVSLLLSEIVEKRYTYTYGGVYALISTAFAVSFVISPICGSTVAKYVNFNWAAWGLAIVIFVTSFVLVFLRNIKGRGEEGASEAAAVEDPTEKTRLLSGSAECSV